MRTKRIYMQPGENGYRVEALWEVEGWLAPHSVKVPTWRAGRAASLEAAMATHYEHVTRAYNAPPWETRADVPDWMRNVALVTTLHGQHYTGYIFNDYAKTLETLRWMATQIPANRVLVFLSSWDGRYYWDYPNYQVNDRMGGEAGFQPAGGRGAPARLPHHADVRHQRRQPQPAGVRHASPTRRIGQDRRRRDGPQLGGLGQRPSPGGVARVHESRRRLVAHVARRPHRRDDHALRRGRVLPRHRRRVDEQHRRPTCTRARAELVADLRAKYPHVPCVGEMHYDALLEFIPMFHSGGGGAAGPVVQRHAKFFQHLSHPAPGRGSSGVHESGFGRFDTETLSLSPVAIPTLNVVDDTFAKYRDVMAAVIAKAKERAGIA